MVLPAFHVAVRSLIESFSVVFCGIKHEQANAVIYTAYLEEGNDIGGIDVGFLARDTVEVDAVTQLGRFEILAYDGSLLNDSPPLLLEGRQVADSSDFPFAVMAVHWAVLTVPAVEKG